MFLHQGTGIIEFTISGYQFPEKKSIKEFDYDANWLMCEIKYSDAGCSETYKEACLLTYELADLKENLSKIIDGSESSYISDFMEPYLKIAVAKSDEKIVLIFHFAHDTLAGIWKDRKICQSLSYEEAKRIRDDLKELIANYPEK